MTFKIRIRRCVLYLSGLVRLRRKFRFIEVVR